FMVPDVYVCVDALPLTTNGKVDRNSLPSVEDADLRRDDYMAPRDAVESKLCELWQEVLKVERVGIDDDFFGLGGHSLLATRLISLVRKTFESEVPLRALFDRPTVRGFAQAVNAMAGTPALPG